MLGGRLVVRGILDLVLYLPYLLFDAAHCCRYRYARKLLMDVYDGNHEPERKFPPVLGLDYPADSVIRDGGVRVRFK